MLLAPGSSGCGFVSNVIFSPGRSLFSTNLCCHSLSVHRLVLVWDLKGILFSRFPRTFVLGQSPWTTILTLGSFWISLELLTTSPLIITKVLPALSMYTGCLFLMVKAFAGGYTLKPIVLYRPVVAGQRFTMGSRPTIKPANVSMNSRVTVIQLKVVENLESLVVNLPWVVSGATSKAGKFTKLSAPACFHT